MRTIISLGLCALMFTLFSGQVFAGNAEECNYLKDKNHSAYAPGLYGLCIAWHNASDDAAGDLAIKFYERAGFDVPGSGLPDTELPDEEPTFACPCWDGVEFTSVCAFGEPDSIIVDAISGKTSSVVWLDFTTFTAEGFGTDGAFCVHAIQSLEYPNPYLYYDNNEGQPLTPDEVLDCQAELDVIAEIHLNEECPEL